MNTRAIVRILSAAGIACAALVSASASAEFPDKPICDARNKLE